MKNIFTFSFALLVCMHTQAQSVSLDSLLIYTELDAEHPSEKYIYSYNEEGQNIKTIHGYVTSYGGNYEFEIESIDSIGYNEQGQIEEIIQFDYYNGVASYYERCTLYYDSQGNVSNTIEQNWNEQNQEWRDAWWNKNRYEDGLLMETTLFYKDQFYGFWDQVIREAYEYDLNTAQIVQKNKFGFDVYQMLESPTSYEKYFYNSDGYLERSEFYDYKSSSSSFILENENEYISDNNGNTLQQLFKEFDENGDEIVSARSSSEYNTTVERSEADLPAEKNVDFHNPTNLIMSSTIELLEEDEWNYYSNETYHYSNLTSTTEYENLTELAIYPNPVHSILNIEHSELLNQGGKVQIVKSDGSVVFSSKLIKSQINVAHLSSGFYHVRVSTKNAIYTGSFIKI